MSPATILFYGLALYAAAGVCTAVAPPGTRASITLPRAAG